MLLLSFSFLAFLAWVGTFLTFFGGLNDDNDGLLKLIYKASMLFPEVPNPSLLLISPDDNIYLSLLIL